ncbi:hypothetical protein WBG99_25430 [Streptomyces sp. TG1A-60]|uniref:hypothetical protein n=1 Tax=Streptomyces sp. TG1A-60 TaxID=3129111 RepID=UPI0030CAC77F
MARDRRRAHLRRAAADETYRKVIYVDEMWTVWGIPGWLLSFGIGIAVLAIKAVAVAIVLRRNTRKQLPPPPPPGAAFTPPGAYPQGPPVPPGTYPQGPPAPVSPTDPKSGPID